MSSHTQNMGCGLTCVDPSSGFLLNILISFKSYVFFLFKSRKISLTLEDIVTVTGKLQGATVGSHEEKWGEACQNFGISNSSNNRARIKKSLQSI